jgi:hypothetical protein
MSIGEQTEPSAGTPVGVNCVGAVAKSPSLQACNARDEPVGSGSTEKVRPCGEFGASRRHATI